MLPHYPDIDVSSIILQTGIVISVTVIVSICATVFVLKRTGKTEQSIVPLGVMMCLSVIAALWGNQNYHGQVERQKALKLTLALQHTGQPFYLNTSREMEFTPVSKNVVDELKSKMSAPHSSDVSYGYVLTGVPLKILSISVDNNNIPKTVFVSMVSDPSSVFSLNAKDFLWYMTNYYSSRKEEKSDMTSEINNSAAVTNLMKEVEASRKEFVQSHP